MKIYITGPGGSWKSTLAQKLGRHFGVSVVHLDELLWNRDGTENEDYPKLQKEAVAQSEWIIEWPSCSIVKSMTFVDAIIILDYPPISNIRRMIMRRFKSFSGKEERLGIFLSDRLSLSFVIRTLFWRQRQLPRLLENIASSGLQERVSVFHGPGGTFEKIIAKRDS